MPAAIAERMRVYPGVPQAIATLGRMNKIVSDEYQQPAIVNCASAIALTVPEKDTVAIAGAILQWLRAHTRFVADPWNQQRLVTPLLMVELIARNNIVGGDCADIAMLSAALALAVGLPCRFVAEGYDGDEVHAQLVHVYTIVQTVPGDPGVWANMDTQRTLAQADTHPVKRVAVDVPE